MEGDDGATEGIRVDFARDLVPKVLLPRWVVQEVADGEGDVVSVVLAVLLEDDIAPGGVEVSARHGCVWGGG